MANFSVAYIFIRPGPYARPSHGIDVRVCLCVCLYTSVVPLIPFTQKIIAIFNLDLNINHIHPYSDLHINFIHTLF